MLKQCYFCKGKVEEKLTTVDFWWGEELFLIKDVPAGVCRQCGEKYFQSETYKTMERLVKTGAVPMAKTDVDVLKFEVA
ncbi:MAG: type II toxin-antitoxin system MqsA family antitoxin [Deltaproteobacteria bacterium]|nr:type II toxin-antitoxin system MqsA family antitoxin [Deltaproteobacteria bacterium]